MIKKKNKFMEADEAISRVKDGDTIMIGGFVDALVRSNKKNLTIISNDLGAPGEGLGKLLSNNQVKSLIGNYYNWNPEVAEAYNAGLIDVKLVPQGTFAESIRAGGVGIPAYYTPTSAGTQIGEGKETKKFGDRVYVLEEALKADISLIRASKSDELGNLSYCKVARNFNPVMAMASKLTIAQVDELLPIGQLDPECVVTQHIFVNAIVKGGTNNA